MRVNIRFRLILLFLLLAVGGNVLLVRHWTSSIRPAHLRSMEESMVDVATLLASLVSEQSVGDSPNVENLQTLINHTQNRQLDAKIYELTKTRVDLRVYVTDRNGIVIFDSESPGEVGYDYNAWNDVLRTLRGEYGARSTRTDPDDPGSSTMYVASPILYDGTTIGVLGVGKHVNNLSLFIETSKQRILKSAVIVTLATVSLIGLVVIGVTRPIAELTTYVRAVGKGERPPVPKVTGSEMKTLAAAFEDMRDELEGKKYVETYVENLTHEMKSPLTAIRANAELLQEPNVPDADRQRFLNNVSIEANRLQSLVDRMLHLAELEGKKQLDSSATVNLSNLIQQISASMTTTAATRTIQFSKPDDPITVIGDSFLLEQAVTNLLQNAIDFSPQDGIINIRLAREPDSVKIIVSDNGPGLPDYALDRATERFFSTPRPNTDRKSSGLGLAFVSEIANLHGGQFTIENSPNSGAVATLKLPLTC